VHAVDRDQRAVEDDVGHQPDPGHRLVQVVGGRGEQGDRLADIAPRGGNPDLESGGQAGEGVAVAQVGQGEQGLPAGVESAPAGSSLVAVGADQVGEVVQRSGWTAGSRRGKTPTRLLVGASSLVDCLSYREPRLTRLPIFTTPLTCTIRLEMAYFSGWTTSPSSSTTWTRLSRSSPSSAWSWKGKGQVEGLWADRTVGLDGVRSDIAMMRTPDGHSKLELTKYHTPAASGAEPENPPPNTLGLHRVMFAVDDIDDTIARLRAHGAELLGEVAQYESIFRLCYLRGPAGSIVALAEQIG
jgi:predicted enzyme related to lactoylglutathione lyase